MTFIDQIRDMIAEGETERSLKELYNYVKENNADVIDQLVLLRSRMQNLQNALANGTMDDQDAAIERAKINEAILKLLPQLTPEYLAQASQINELKPPAPQPQKSTPLNQTPLTTPSRKRNMIYLAGGAVFVIVLLIIIFSNGGGSSGDEDLVQQEAAMGSGQSEGTLLAQVLSDGAVWVSDNGNAIFQFESDQICNELNKDSQIAHTFNVINNDQAADYITLHDASRNMYLLIGKTTVQFQSGGEDTWNDLYKGQWVIPTDE